MRDSCSPPPQDDHDIEDDAQHIKAVVVKEESAASNSTINLKLTRANDQVPMPPRLVTYMQPQLQHPTELTPSAS